MNFGDLIKQKRATKQIALRKMSASLDISAPYLSDVEKDQRNPFDMDRLEVLSDILLLSAEDKATMFNLAGKRRKAIALDLLKYIIDRDYVSAALRTARDLNVTEEVWGKFEEELKKLKR